MSEQKLRKGSDIHPWDSIQEEAKTGCVPEILVWELLTYKLGWLAAIFKAIQRQMKPTRRKKQRPDAKKHGKGGLMTSEPSFPSALHFNISNYKASKFHIFLKLFFF